MNPIRVFVIDEMKICRDSMRTAIAGAKDIEVVGESPSGRLALERVGQLEPDLIIASSSLKDITASELTKQMLSKFPRLGIILTIEQYSLDVDAVVESLEIGAFDYLMKPKAKKGSEEQISILERLLLPKIRSFSTAKYSRMAKEISRNGTAGAKAVQADKAGVAADTLIREWKENAPGKYELVVVGVSTGGPEALSKLIPSLPASFPVPVVIVLHLPREFTRSLVNDLNQKSSLTVKEANEGELVRPGCVYLAKGGAHLLVKRDVQKNLIFRVSDSPPRQGCRPSVDVLFESAARACSGAVIALILTGMGTDGVKGLGDLKSAGAKVIAQDEVSSVVWGMPGSAVRANLTDYVKPLSGIVEKLFAILDGHD